MLFEIRQPKYEWGQRVCAAIDLVNDGSHPEVPADALLVPAGGRGEIVQVGHHSEANLPVYLVEFEGGPVVGCLEEEITLAGVASAVAALGAPA
jgi:nitrogen fixation protein NifZ